MLLREVPTPQRPELHLDLSRQQKPVLDFDVSTLHALERPVMLLEKSTPQHRGLSCTWTCLDNRSLCSSWTYLHYRGLCCTRAYLVVSTHWGLSFTWTCRYFRVLCCTWTCFLYRGLRCTWARACLDISSCAVPGLIYATDVCAALGGVYTLSLSFTWTCLTHMDQCLLIVERVFALKIIFCTCAAPGRVYITQDLSCTWTCTNYKFL